MISKKTNNIPFFFKCLNCSSKISINNFGKAKVNCPKCDKTYPIIDGVLISISSSEDFYKYNNKLSRFINLKK